MFRKLKPKLIAIILFTFLPYLLFADEIPKEEPVTPSLDKADTVWMLVSSALVFFMIPGLALFYGGIVKSKNVLSTMMHSFIAIIVMTLQWTVIGLSLIHI